MRRPTRTSVSYKTVDPIVEKEQISTSTSNPFDGEDETTVGEDTIRIAEDPFELRRTLGEFGVREFRHGSLEKLQTPEVV